MADPRIDVTGSVPNLGFSLIDANGDVIMESSETYATALLLQDALWLLEDACRRALPVYYNPT